MKLVVQRVRRAKVEVAGNIVGEIGGGLFVLFAAGLGDTKKQADLLAEKLVKLRILADEKGKMNLSVTDTKSQVLVVSQFTLYADVSDGNRPSFIKAKDPEEAEDLYEYFIKLLKEKGIFVKTGVFGEHMKIDCEMDGPVTIIAQIEN